MQHVNLAVSTATVHAVKYIIDISGAVSIISGGVSNLDYFPNKKMLIVL